MNIYDYLTQHGVRVLLANPASLKAMVGKKTDVDAIWLAYLHMAGLVNPSYTPDKPYRQLRNLCRTRQKIVTIKTHQDPHQKRHHKSDPYLQLRDHKRVRRHLRQVRHEDAENPTKPARRARPTRPTRPHQETAETGRGTGPGEGPRRGSDSSPLGELREAGLKEAKVHKIAIALRRAYTPSIDARMTDFLLELIQSLDRGGQGAG